MSPTDPRSSSDDSSDAESLLADDPCASLFESGTVLPSVSACIEYDADHHRFDLRRFSQRRHLFFYDVVKLVNFIRSSTARGQPASVTVEQISSDTRPWDDEFYLKPAILDDPLLFAIEEDVDDGAAGTAEQLKAENDALRAEIRAMKDTFKSAFGLGDDNDADAVQQQQGQDVVARDREYFSGYSCVDIHEVMLRDSARTGAYESFCNRNRHLFEDKVVLDVGCGSGILCLFAARAGARRVIGVENAEIVHKARRVVARNGFADVIEIIEGKVEDIDLDCKVDLIISEWMGYFLLFESMLTSVLVARDRFLIDPASVYPDRAALLVAGAHTRSLTNRGLDFWKNAYGFDLSDIADDDATMKRCRNSGRAWVDTLPADAVFTDAAIVKHIDISHVVDADLDFVAPFSLRAANTETLDAIVSYFVVDFAGECRDPIQLSTAPDQATTHWQQTIFMLSEPIPMERDQVVVGELRAARLASSPRSYDVTLHLDVAGRKLPPQCFSLSL